MKDGIWSYEWFPDDDPGFAAVTTASAKEYARIDAETVSLDAEVARLVTEGTEWAQSITLHQLKSGKRYLYLNGFFGAKAILLPHIPVSSVTSIAYVDTAGNTQTWSAIKYTVDRTTRGARIVPAYGEAWPDVRRQPKAVTILYTSGYASAADYPPGMVAAILTYVRMNFEPVEMRESYLAAFTRMAFKHKLFFDEPWQVD
jgi:uncharacterized phiE125 gp8 family phage protein